MNAIRTSRILISGIGSVGVEIAKNLILAGVHDVVIHDTKPVEWNDLSAQVFSTYQLLKLFYPSLSFLRLNLTLSLFTITYSFQYLFVVLFGRHKDW